MYKLLPILLFGFLIAEEKPPFAQKAVSQMIESLSSVYDSLMNEETFNARIYNKKYQTEHYINFMLSDMLNPDNFIISTDFQIIDSVFCDVESNCIPEYFNSFTKDTSYIHPIYELSNRISSGNIPGNLQQVDSIMNAMADSIINIKRIKPVFIKEFERKGLYIGLIRDKEPNLSYKDYYNPTKFEHLIITAKLNINIMLDNEITSDYYKQNIIDLITSEKPYLKYCDDCISFDSVDMDSLRGVNEEVKSTISLNRDDIYDDSWAVIIGIDKYKYSDQLNYAVKDAEAVKDMLISKFDYPKENIRYLIDEEATLSNIKLNLGEVATSAGEDDRILVFYSGHGETSKGADGSETGYIVPYEGKMENLYATGLAMDDILRTCQLSKSKHMLFLMDACYSGLMTENVKSLSKPQEEGYLSKVANEKARQIITAGGRDEQVIERDEWQHSAFTKNLLAGLDDWESDTDSDGYVTADELGTYLRKSVTEDSDFQQTPQKGRFRNSGGGEFVFFSNHRTNKPNLVDQVRKTSGDDIVVKKVVDRRQGWYEKYGYEGRSIGFFAFEDMFSIAYNEDFDNNWHFTIMNMQIGNNAIKNITNSNSSYSLSANLLGFAVGYKYRFNNVLMPHIISGASYMMTSWEDIVQKTSGDKNIILFLVGVGVEVSPFQFEQPFPMEIGISIGFRGAYLPTSYAFNDGIATLEEWQIKFLPSVVLLLEIPK